MAKKLLATGFRIDRDNNAIYINGNILLQRLLLITDVTTNRIIYNFADEGSGVLSRTYDVENNETKFVFRLSLAALNVANTDILQVLVENEATEIRPEDPFIDPVSKLRVSQPENLIDTDFEYGLQTTKWETLKLVNNVPSFYSKNGANAISVFSVQATEGSTTVLVNAPDHGLTAGSPFEITGLSNSQYEGGYIVTSVISTSQFTYQLTFAPLNTLELSTVYTAVIPGAFYFGSQITVSDIETNGLNPSHLIVKTKFPHGFSLNTPFYFLNTVAIYRQDIPIANFVVDDTTTNEKSTTSTSIGESVLDYRITSVTPYKFIGKGTLYWDNSNINTAINAPISSARINNGGAGYVSNPVATPVFNSAATYPTVNSVTFNATSTGVVVGTGANAGRITTTAHTFVTGDRVEYHMEGATVASLVGSAPLIRDPYSWVSSNLFMGEQTANQPANEANAGYSPAAFGTGVSFGGATVGATTGLLIIDTSSYYGNLKVGQEVRLWSTSGTTTVAPTLVFPEGTVITQIDQDGSSLRISVQFPYALATGLSAVAAVGAIYAASISSVNSTIRTTNHGFVTGDRVYYRRVVTPTGTVNANSPQLAVIGNLSDSTPYYVIRVDAGTYRLATTYVNALRGIYVKFTNIGSGCFNSAIQRFLPGNVFLASNSSLYARVLSSTTLQLHPTRTDALNNTNVITITTAGTGTAQRISAAPAVFSTTVTGSTVSSISTIDSGWAYDKNSAIAVAPFVEVRSLDLSGFSGGTRVSGSTNTLTFRANLYDRPIYVGMLVSGTGIAANTIVNTVSVPDVNNIVVVQISANINANITHGQLISFSDNPGSTASIVPNIRVSCFNVPGHGYNLGNPLWFYNPPGNTFPSSITASRNYFVYPIDEDNFALLTALTFPAAYSQANSNARIVLNTGTILNNRKFVATRSFRITGANGSALQVGENLNVSYGLTNGDPFIVTNTTGNGSIGSVATTNATDATVNNSAHTIYYTRVIAQSGAQAQREFTFATTTSGAVTTPGGRSGESFITPIVILAESDSIYVPSHGFLANEYIIYTATNTAIEGVNPYSAGATLAAAGNNGYLVDKVSDDRIRLKRRDDGTIVDLRGFGTGTHTFTNVKYSSTANTVNKPSHGFLANQTVIYDSSGAPIVDGLRNTTEYFIKPVNSDNFRVSTTTQELPITSIAKTANTSTITIAFNTNHSLSVGDSIIIRDNPIAYMNGFWTVATVPATPTINAAPSTITLTVPVFTNPAPAITQNAATGITYGLAYKYVDFAYVTARRSIITPVPAGKTFTTLKAIDGLLDKKTPSANGGGIVTNHLIKSSDVLPFESRVSAVTGTNVRTARILFKPRDIQSAVRASNVVTVTTTADHGYANSQTVMIQGLPTTSFNTTSPVTITTTGTNTFTFAQTGSDETATVDADSISVMALTSAQAALLSSVGHDASSGANNVSVAAGSLNATFVTATVATATQLSNVTKTLAAGAGLINQYTLIVPDTLDLKPGMPVVGTGINTDSRILRILSPTQIELTAPNTATTTAGTYTFFKIQAGQEVTQATPNLTTVAAATANANINTFTVKSSTNLANGMYIDGNRSTTTFAATAPEGNTFEVASTSNIYSESRVQTDPAVSSATPYNSNAVFVATGNTAVTTGFTTNTTGTGFSNIRAFKADSGNDVYAFNDGRPSAILNSVRLPQHPYVTGDVIRYFSNGGNDVGGLTNGNVYYIIKVNENYIQLATTLENAQAATAIVITGYGTGSQHYFRGNVFWGNSFTGGGTLNVGHHVNATTAGFTSGLPQGSVVLSKRSGFLTQANSYRGVAFVVGYKDANNTLDETVYLADAYRVGSIGATTGDEPVVNTSVIRGGFGSVGNRIFCDDTTNLQVGMVPVLAANAAGTAGVLVNSPAATVVTSIAVDGKSFTVSQAPSTALFGTRLIAGAGSVSNTLTCTATSSVTNAITTSGNTANIEVNSPVIFSGTTIGTILTNTVYYVKQILSATTFTVSETISGGTAGPVKTLTTATGSMVLNSHMVYTTSTTGLIPGMAIEMLAGIVAGAPVSTGAVANNTRIAAIIDSNRFILTDAPSTAFGATRFVAGVSSGAGTGLTNNIYVPSSTGFKVGQLLTYISGTAGAFPAATNYATQAVIQSVNVTNPLKPTLICGTANATTGVITAGNTPTTRLQGAVIAAGIGSSTPTTSIIRVPSTVGLNTGMTVAVTAGTGTLAATGLLITDIDPVLNTFTVGASPTVALTNASITGTIAGAVVTGLYVNSTEANFPENVTVTAVNGTTITISDIHGGVTSGTRVTFSPFPVGAYVTAFSGTAPNITVTLNSTHAGVLGGTAVNFNRLPPRTFLGSIPPYAASNWALRLEFTTPLPFAYTAESRPLVFTGSNKNLGDNVAFKSYGTHIFTRASDADGVYIVEDIPDPTTFVVQTTSNIPFNTKSFVNTDINTTQDYIRIANHKFRDGTSLIYRPGNNTLITTAEYIDKDGVTQNTLVSGQTYYAVVVDPNFVKLAATFDAAISPTPTTLDLTGGTNGAQSFDTYSILGLTRGLGTVVVTENSDIITGIGTKFLTNFKGGDVLRFYTAANPGKIFNYPIVSVKSDTSIKLRSPITPDAVVKVNLLTDRLVTAGTAVTSGQQTITLSSVADLAIGYYMFDTNGRFRPNTRITAINTGTKVVTLDQYLVSTFAANAPITIQPVFEYFISTNIYVKSNATTTHRPFDGGVSMTTGLVPDSSIIRQSRKYFRYQSGKGIQVSIAINFNPPTDCEELTSNENIAKIKVDAPHGFKPGTSNKIRISDATVPSGHNGYNGQFDILTVEDEYSFTYVYEDTPLFGTVTNENNTITSVWNFTGVEVGKTIKAGTYSGITVPENTIITAVNTNTKVLTLTNALTGSSPTVGISSIARLNDTVTVETSSNHGLTTGDYISISGTGVGANFNGFSASVTVVNATTFTYTQAGINTTENSGTVIKQIRLPIYRQNGSSVAYGFPKYNLVNWKDAAVRCGLFDSQNGMFFEYDGEQLYCARRSSVQQISGRINATYRSSLITGEKTKFTTQLNIGEYVVIRGMSYKIIGIDSDTQMYIQPEYRGSTLTNIVGTKTIDTKIPQSQWNLDRADGNGRSGYVLDMNKIQMVYIDYSWYGAGKIRFGFKDQRGEVRYFHEFIHNNEFVEAYMRSGNIPARYEVVTFGEPTFSPQLFHWGTSVIMDGRFDDDKAYLFTADSSIITLTNGGTQIVPPNTPTTIRRNSNNFRVLTLNSGKFIVGSSISVQNDFFNRYLPAGTFVQSVAIVPGTNPSESLVTLTKNFREDINVTGTQAAPVANGQAFNFLVGGGITNTSIAALTPVPLVSIRLSPSVDNGLTGGLGFRDIINRMQLTLNSCGVLLTHECEIKLFLNSDLSDSNFINNTAPSLSQIYKHSAGETIKNGIQLFSFRAGGGSIINATTGQRSLVQTTAELGEVAQLGNSILGGDETFPNGPDILTITATPIDTSTINGSAPFQASARITWSESQA